MVIIKIRFYAAQEQKDAINARVPILRDSIHEEECAAARKESLKEGKEKLILHSKFRKVIGWKGFIKIVKTTNNGKFMFTVSK